MLTQEQIALRQGKVTGSTVAAYLGFSPYCSPLEQWEIDAGLRAFKGNDATIAGNELEDGLGKWACKDLLIADPETPGTLVHPQDPWAAATPDLISRTERLGVQIKCHMPAMARKYLERPGKQGKWDNALVPLYINMQCQWEMHVTAAWAQDPKFGETWVLVAYFGGGDRRVYWIRRDGLLIRQMRAAALRFWTEHLNPAGPHKPPADWPWSARPQREVKKVKLTPSELQAAPVPFTGAPGLFNPKTPFSE